MEIVIDNFAGGGGASTGMEIALGRSVDIAINHDPAAIAMHKANHPTTKHYCEDVWEVDPVEAVGNNTIGLAWFSPDCKHFSKAKGRKPVDKNIRGLAWVSVKWAISVRPRVIMLENVEEFKTWGPLDEEGYPIEERKGETFKAFIDCLTTGLKDRNHPAWPEIKESLGKYFSKNMLVRGLGYSVEWKELIACDFGAPTSRKRFFLILRSDGKAIVWPRPTHGHPESEEVRMGLLKPWRTAAEIIDWSLPCPSIFSRRRPLSENTMRRIAKGMQKFVINSPDPFIVRIGQTGFGGDRLSYSLDKPLTTITSKAEHLLVTPFLAAYHTETQSNEVRGSGLRKPINTIDTSNRYGLVSAFIARNFKASVGHKLSEPLGTTTTVNKSSLVTAFLVKYYGSDIGQSINTPIHTITTKDRFGLVKIQGDDYQIIDIGMRMLEPHELFKGQGFPDNYIIKTDYKGNIYPKTEQVARCGNSVSPPIPAALVTANLPEMCTGGDQKWEYDIA